MVRIGKQLGVSRFIALGVICGSEYDFAVTNLVQARLTYAGGYRLVTSDRACHDSCAHAPAPAFGKECRVVHGCVCAEYEIANNDDERTGRRSIEEFVPHQAHRKVGGNIAQPESTYAIGNHE